MNMMLETYKAMVALLQGDVTLVGMVQGVFDVVPQGMTMPYIAFGEMRATDWSSVMKHGLEIEVRVEIYSAEHGRKQVMEIAERLKTLLHRADFTITGYTLVECVLLQLGMKRNEVGAEGVMTFGVKVRG